MVLPTLPKRLWLTSRAKAGNLSRPMKDAGYCGSVSERLGAEPRLCMVFFLDYRVYAAGGMGLDLRPHNYLQHYDMLKDMWVSLAPMPTPRYAATSFLRGSKIYVLGKDRLLVRLPSLLPWVSSLERDTNSLRMTLAVGDDHAAPRP